jgi:putative ABC transport system permease protein
MAAPPGECGGMMSVSLANTDLLWAALLLVLNGAISLAFGLRLELNLAMVVLRMVVQVAAIGVVLRFVFLQSSPLWTAAIALLMLLVAGYELAERQERRFRGWWTLGLGNAALLFASGLATLYAVTVVIAPSPWYAPRYLLPILGLVLGSTLTSISLVLQTLADAIERERGAIEARMAQGGTRIEAFAPLLRRAMHTATTPLLNVISLAGLVTLPGMMTGQILAGADPIEAARYQIVVVFVLAGAAGLGALAAAIGGMLIISDRRHRLRLDRLAPFA